MKNNVKMVATTILLTMFTGTVNAQLPAFILKTDTSEITVIDLDEIFVLNWRESYKLKDLPASVSLVSSGMIEKAEMRTIKDLTSLVPNFFMPDYGSRLTSPVYIRGIGSRIDSPSAGLYIDNIPYFDKAAFDFDLFDIESIEVLRGPQGTLYGRNTISGLVNVNTRSPMHYQGTRFMASAGNYGYLAGNASHYHKLNESTAFSLAGNYMQREGFHLNEYLGDPVDGISSYILRGRLVRKFGNYIQAELVAGFEKLDQGGYPYAIFNDSLGRAEAINYNDYSSFKRSMLSGAFTMAYSGKNLNVNYTAGYHHLLSEQAIDQDFSPAKLFFVTQDQNQKLFTQELIFKSDEDHPYRWTSGLFWFRQILDKDVSVDHLEDAWPIYHLPGLMTLHRDYHNPVNGAAIFHQSAYEDLFIPNLSLTAGLRLDYEKTNLDYAYQQILGESSTMLTEFTSDLNFFELLPKLAMKYTYSPGKWSYFSVARGYKTGGFNTSFEREEDRSFLPEYTWNYETGLKMRWSSLLTAEMAVFYIDWKDQQIYQPIPSGRGSMLKNAGHSFSRGAEFSVRAMTLNGFDFHADYGFTDARFISNEPDSTRNYNGNRIPYVPLHTLALGAGKKFKINSKWADFFSANIHYRYLGKHYWNEENTHFQDGYGILNTRVTVARGIFSLNFWAKNILGTDYHSFYFTSMGNSYVQKGKPFNAGINFSLTF